MLSGERFIENQAQRENIRARIRFLVEQNFWRHVSDRPAGGFAALLGIIAGHGIGAVQHRPRHAKIQNLYLILRRQHDVFGLDVAVHHALLVRRGQCRSALHGDLEKGRRRKCTARSLP